MSGKKQIPKVWRKIVKKSEKQPDGKKYDVLICKHAVPANDNRYRIARSCPECAIVVQAHREARGETRP